MAPQPDSPPPDSRRSDSRSSDSRKPEQDPVELATQLVMLPAEVVWSMFGRAMAVQAKVLIAMTRHATGHAPGAAPSTSRSTDNPR